MRSHHGFTVLELLTVMAVVAILLAAGVPSFQTFAMNQRMEGAVFQMISDLHYARFGAVDRNSRITACPGDERLGCNGNNHWDQGWIIFEDTNADRQRQAGEELLRVANPLSRLTIRSSSSRNTLTFFPNGTAPGSNATIWFCDRRGAEKGQQVRLSLTGRIRGTSTDGDGSGRC